MKSEYNLDWTYLPTPDNTLFPLVDMEQRKRMAIKLGASLSFKFDKAYAKDEIEADALYLLYDDEVAFEMQKADKRKNGIPATAKEQALFLYNCVRRIISRELRLDGPYGGVVVHGAKNRYDIYDENHRISEEAEYKLSEYTKKNRGEDQ